MKGYIYKSIWNERKSKWTEEELVSNTEIEEKMFLELCDLLDKYKICQETYIDYNTKYRLRNDEGVTINYFYGKEALPWVD